MIQLNMAGRLTLRAVKSQYKLLWDSVPKRAEVYELTWAMGSGLKAQAHVLTEPNSLGTLTAFSHATFLFPSCVPRGRGWPALGMMASFGKKMGQEGRPGRNRTEVEGTVEWVRWTRDSCGGRIRDSQVLTTPRRGN